MHAFSYIVSEDVTPERCPWLNNTIKEGTIVYLYHGHDYGCISPNGTAVTLEPEKTPFFELPNDVLQIPHVG